MHPAHQGKHLVFADGDARLLGVLDKHVFVEKLLPGGVADLLLGLLVTAGAEELVDGRVTVDVRLEIRIGAEYRRAYGGEASHCGRAAASFDAFHSN